MSKINITRESVSQTMHQVTKAVKKGKVLPVLLITVNEHQQAGLLNFSGQGDEAMINDAIKYLIYVRDNMFPKEITTDESVREASTIQNAVTSVTNNTEDSHNSNAGEGRHALKGSSTNI